MNQLELFESQSAFNKEYSRLPVRMRNTINLALQDEGQRRFAQGFALGLTIGCLLSVIVFLF